MIRGRRTENQHSMIRIMEQLALAWESGSTAHPRPSAPKKKNVGAQDQLAVFAPSSPKLYCNPAPSESEWQRLAANASA